MSMLFGIGMPGPLELAIILGILLLLFGGARLPGLMRNIGRSAVEFRKGMQGIEDDMNDALEGGSGDNDADKPDKGGSADDKG